MASPRGGAALPARGINQLQEGDRIRYAPGELARANRKGRVALVVAPAGSTGAAKITVLEVRDAGKPAEWTVPFRVGVLGLAVGPQGLDRGKVRSMVNKDQELIAQLADYAQQTAQTEALLSALQRANQSAPSSQDLGLALVDFYNRLGAGGRLDQNAAPEQQMATLLRTVNPALATLDPLAPSPRARIQQGAGLAAAVAGLFFGSTIGLAAGTAALFANVHLALFPGMEFRSALAQGAGPGISLCAPRETTRSRTRLGYLWATRLADTEPPTVAVEGTPHLPLGLSSPVTLRVPEAQWRLLDRVQRWALTAEGQPDCPVAVRAQADKKSALLDLSGCTALPGTYRLGGMWDWQPFAAEGAITLHPLGDLSQARVAAHSLATLQPDRGTIMLTLEGADFQFLEAVAWRPWEEGAWSVEAKPQPLRFMLPRGRRAGEQTTVQLEWDTQGLKPGRYQLLLTQVDKRTRDIAVTVPPPHPRIENLPLALHAGESEQTVTLRGSGLERIEAVAAEGITFDLAAARPGSGSRELTARWSGESQPDDARDLSVQVAGVPVPLRFQAAVTTAGPRPKVLSVQASVPPESGVALREGELPAHGAVSFALRVDHLGAVAPSVTVGCRESARLVRAMTVRAGEQNAKEEARLRVTGPDTLFLSLAPGLVGQAGCSLTAVVDAGARSAPAVLGTVVRVPRIERFELTDEKAGEGLYYAVLRGQDLETIEKVGWDGANGVAVTALPTPVDGAGRVLSLRVAIPWPSPTPRAPLYLWLRGEAEGRATTARY